jgi:hypothetical protein
LPEGLWVSQYESQKNGTIPRATSSTPQGHMCTSNELITTLRKNKIFTSLQ